MLTFFEPRTGWAANRTSGPGLGLLLLMSLPHNSFGTRIQLYPTNQVLFRSWLARSCLRPPGGGEERTSAPLPPLPTHACPARSRPHRALSGDQGRLGAPFHRSGARLARPSTAKGFRLFRPPPPSTRRPLLFGATGRRGEGIRTVLDRPLLHPVRNPNLSWLLGWIAPRPVPRDRSFREL